MAKKAAPQETKKKAANGKRNGTNRQERQAQERQKQAQSAQEHTVRFSMKDEILMWLMLGVSVLILIGNFGFGGFVGNAVSRFCLGIFGFGAYVFPFAMFLLAAFLIANKKSFRIWIKTAGMLLFWTCFCVFAELLNGFEKEQKLLEYYTNSVQHHSGGGLFGGALCKLLCPALGIAGAYIVVAVCAIIALILITERSLFAGMQRGSARMYASAKKDVRSRRERAQMKRAEEERKSRLKMSEDGVGDEAIPKRRMDRKVSGVNFDVLTVAKKPAQEEKSYPDSAMYHPEERMDSAVWRSEERKEAAAHQRKEPEFTIQRPEEKRDFEFTIQRPEEIVEEEILEDREKESETEPAEAVKRMADAGGRAGDADAAETEAVLEEETPACADMENARRRTVKRTKSTAQEQKESTEQVADEIARNEKKQKPRYVFPPLTLLGKGKRGRVGDSNDVLRMTAQKLQDTLHSFGVEVHVTNISCGPTVTRYELTPEQGVKVSRIVNLADDIKLNLAAADIRIEAPIPGKAAVGIEVPNKENSPVYLRELLESREFREHSSNLAIAVGKDLSGKPVIADIAKMPHLLIAGATGSGKSVCINTIIMSLIYKAKPEDVKLIMIDPKVVELSVYNGIPHLFIPVVTDPKKAAGALNWAVAEMTDRYQKFAEYHVRNLSGYNEKVESIAEIEDETKPEKMPQIVIIVDELADLMMVAPGEVEDAICRLAQLARAAGIHLIIATQRPSVNVITGLIKANMPSRIAFEVSSGVDSRTILDMNGAEKLLGKGDMLFYPQGYQKPARVQGTLVTDTEVAEVVNAVIGKNMTAEYDQKMEQQMTKVQEAAEVSGGNQDVDEYFAQAGKAIIEKDKASIGMLQRIFKIGFNRAARIMDQLAEAGVVGPEEGTKPRKVLMSMEQFENYLEQE